VGGPTPRPRKSSAPRKKRSELSGRHQRGVRLRASTALSLFGRVPRAQDDAPERAEEGQECQCQKEPRLKGPIYRNDPAARKRIPLGMYARSEKHRARRALDGRYCQNASLLSSSDVCRVRTNRRLL
jgi:hypothetical protein